jgi:5-methyltetrahydrofolate--homocysteine methyltransferase
MAPEDPDAVSDVARDTPVPTPPFWGDRIVKGIALKDYVAYLDERALFRGQWGLSPGKNGPDYDELVETEGRPRLRSWLSRVASEGLLEAAVIYGYWPAHSDGNAIVVGDPQEPQREVARFDFPRQKRGRHLCLADYVRPDGDVLGLQIVTMGSAIDRAAAELFEKNAYRDYLELHGLSVQLTEALAEYWHSRVRAELSIDADDSSDMAGILKQKYRGERFAFGYPACPDLSQQKPLVELLGADRVGVSLSEEFQLDPEQSTSALIFHHPEAGYFNAT